MSITRRSSLRGTPSKIRDELGEATVEEESTPQKILTRRKRDAVSAVLEESSKSRSITPTGKNRKLASEDTLTDSPAITEQTTSALPASASSTRQRKQPTNSLPSTSAKIGTPTLTTRGGRNPNKLADLKQEAAVAAVSPVITPRKSRRLSESLVIVPVVEVCATPPRRGQKVSEAAKTKELPETAAAVAVNSEPAAGTPRKSRRLSETVPVVPTVADSCATPTRRSKKVSETKDAVEGEAGTPIAGTPRKSRRLSETLPPTGTPVEAIATLPPRNRKVSELAAAAVGTAELRAASPVRKSRRLSGGGVDEDGAMTVGRPVLLTPTKTSRRRSICTLDIPPVIAEEQVTKVVDEKQMEEESIEVTNNKMEVITEVDEEESRVVVVETPTTAVEVEQETVVPTQPEAIKSVVVQPEVVQPDVVGLQATVPEVATAGVTIPEVALPDQPEDVHPEVIPPIKATEISISSKEEGKKNVVEMGEALEALQRLMLPQVPRQKPKSGKFWKADRSQFRAIRKDKGPRKTFEQRLKTKEDIQRAKDLAAMLIQAKVAAKQDHRRRIEENKKRREERERAAEVYQVVRNPNKIKKMKRKDLVKRDILGKVQA